MRAFLPRRILTLSAALTAWVLLAYVQAGPAAMGLAAPTTRSYSAHVASGTGRFARATGTLRVTLKATRTKVGTGPVGGGTRYTVSITVRSSPCGAATKGRPCPFLSGTLSGSGISQSRPPDIGQRIVLTASGRVSPLGAVTASGAYTGTGFIARGRRSIELRLRSKAGDLSISGVGPLVPGFTQA